MNLHTRYKSELVVAVACVTGCDIILSHCNELRFDSEEKQEGISGHVLSRWLTGGLQEE